MYNEFFAIIASKTILIIMRNSLMKFLENNYVHNVDDISISVFYLLTNIIAKKEIYILQKQHKYNSR